MIKKIIFYSDTPLFGGAEKQMLLLAKNLNREKFEPIVVCGNYTSLDQFCEELTNSKIKVKRIAAPNKHSFKNYTEFKKFLKSTKPDFLHIHVWNPMAGKYAILAGKLNRIPIITTEHDPFKLFGAKKLFKKTLLKLVDKIITVSKANEKLMSDLYPKIKNKLVTIHNGIDLETIETQLQSINNKGLHKDLSKKIILSVGTLHERKGFRYLIEAFAKVYQKHPETKLIIMGEGPERPYLENLIKNLHLDQHCLLKGWRDNIIEIMAESSIFVLPSVKEAFGLVIVEAFACKLPVIATNVGGIPEIMTAENGKTAGLLVPSQNSEKLADIMIKLLENTTLQKELSLLGYKRSKEFNIEKNARETEQLYLNLLKKFNKLIPATKATQTKHLPS